MATLLYRLGRFSYRRAWIIVLVWVALVAGVVGGGFSLGGTSQESYEIPGTESQVALDRLSAVFPSVAGSSVQVTNAAPDGQSIDDYKAAIEKQAEELAAIPGVDTVVAPWDEYAGYSINKDQTMALTKVQFVVSKTPVSDARPFWQQGQQHGMPDSPPSSAVAYCKTPRLQSRRSRVSGCCLRPSSSS
jgi:putative drug exporter of the RND superfamily